MVALDAWELVEEANEQLRAAAQAQLVTVRANLGRVIAQSGRPLREIAFVTGLAENTIRAFLSGKAETSVKTILLVCQALGVEASTLFK